MCKCFAVSRAITVRHYTRKSTENNKTGSNTMNCLYNPQESKKKSTTDEQRKQAENK